MASELDFYLVSEGRRRIFRLVTGRTRWMNTDPRPTQFGMPSASLRDMRTRRRFVQECGRATRCALLPGLAVLSIAMGLVVVTPPLAGGAQTEHFTVELFWTRCPASSSAPVEVLSAFLTHPRGHRPPRGWEASQRA